MQGKDKGKCDLRWSRAWDRYGVFHRGWLMAPEWASLSASAKDVFLLVLTACSPSRADPHRSWLFYDSEIADILSIDRTTVHRARRTLVSAGLVRIEESPSKHRRGQWRWWLLAPEGYYAPSRVDTSTNGKPIDNLWSAY